MDENLLLYEMRKSNVSRKEMCDILGLSRTAFYRKCKGISQFTQEEIGKMINLLNVKDPIPIFFNDSVS